MNRTEHLLTILSEECNETAQRVSKALRFGLNEVQLTQQLTNADRIVYEFNDIVAVMEILHKEGLLKKVIDREAIEKKKQKVTEFLEYSKACGTLIEKELPMVFEFTDTVTLASSIAIKKISLNRAFGDSCVIAEFQDSKSGLNISLPLFDKDDYDVTKRANYVEFVTAPLVVSAGHELRLTNYKKGDIVQIIYTY